MFSQTLSVNSCFSISLENPNVLKSAKCFLFSVKTRAVYIRADLDTLKQHIKKRGREEEANLDPAFLQRLQRCHEDWLYYGNSTFGPPSSQVIVVDSQVTVEELARKVIALKDTIIPPYVLNGQ